MDLKQLVVLALQVSVACTVVGFGLRTTVHDLLYLVRRPGLLARSLLAMFVVMPVVAVLLAVSFDFRPTVETSLDLSGDVPDASSPAAEGNQSRW